MTRQAPRLAATGEITSLLAAARGGDGTAVDRLMALVYDELHAVARRQLGRRRRGQTLDTTALVHEAYLKLMAGKTATLQDRSHFFSVAALAMRHVLVDEARRRAAKKRGGDEVLISCGEHLGSDQPSPHRRALEILAIDRALISLATVDKRLGRLVELRFFGGLTEEETAEVMETSERTVRRDWRKAKAFLFQALGGEAGG